MGRTRVQAYLEIDHERGVMYVHLDRRRDINRYGRETVLRISGLPTPIPEFDKGLLDIGLSTDGWTTSWNGQGLGIAPE